MYHNFALHVMRNDSLLWPAYKKDHIEGDKRLQIILLDTPTTFYKCTM